MFGTIQDNVSSSTLPSTATKRCWDEKQNAAHQLEQFAAIPGAGPTTSLRSNCVEFTTIEDLSFFQNSKCFVPERSALYFYEGYDGSQMSSDRPDTFVNSPLIVDLWGHIFVKEPVIHEEYKR